MSRILFFGDLAATGFGTVTMDLGRELLALGHDVRFVSQNELDGDLPEPFASRTFDLSKAAPTMLDPDRAAFYGRDSLALTSRGVAGLIDGTVWADKWTAEATIVLGDFTGVRLVVTADAATRAAFSSVPSWHYVPIEGLDLPPAWDDVWQVLQPVAMSNFGADQIERIHGSRPPVIHHGVDTEAFYPVSAERPIYLETRKLRTKDQCKELFGGSEDQLWVLRTDRHMPRKRYASMLRGIAPVIAARPNVWMIMHCRGVDQGGVLADTLSKYPPPVRSRMLHTGLIEKFGGLSRPLLNALYNAADIYVSTSAEGFGLTIAEAMACGVPAVGMDYSAVPEVIGPGGLLAPALLPLDNEYDHLWAGIDEAIFGAQVTTLVDDPKLRRSLGEAATRHVRQSFSWSRAAMLFDELIRARLGVEEVVA